MELLSFLGKLASLIEELHQHLDATKTVIAALPEDQRGEATVAVLSATQKLGDLYSDFSAEMLRLLTSEGTA